MTFEKQHCQTKWLKLVVLHMPSLALPSPSCCRADLKAVPWFRSCPPLPCLPSLSGRHWQGSAPKFPPSLFGSQEQKCWQLLLFLYKQQITKHIAILCNANCGIFLVFQCPRCTGDLKTEKLGLLTLFNSTSVFDLSRKVLRVISPYVYTCYILYLSVCVWTYALILYIYIYYIQYIFIWLFDSIANGQQTLKNEMSTMTSQACVQRLRKPKMTWDPWAPKSEINDKTLPQRKRHA